MSELTCKWIFDFNVIFVDIKLIVDQFFSMLIHHMACQLGSKCVYSIHILSHVDLHDKTDFDVDFR
mgnify:CR=1 FL=1